MSFRPPILLSARITQALQNAGINTLHPVNRVHFPGMSIFEPPCSLKWLKADHSFEIGAFSYAVSGYFFACKIGRYCSFGEDVNIGRHSHPLDFVSTSPIFYQKPDAVLGISRHPSLPNQLTHPSRPPTTLKQTVIGNDVYIGHGAFILPGVNIGHGAIIGARSVVTKDVPPYSIVAGCPAKVVRYRFDDSLIERLLTSEWWQYAPSQYSGLDPALPDCFIQAAARLKSKGSHPYKPTKLVLHSLAATTPSIS